MAELATIARPYAEAAFAIARDAQALPAWSDMLRFAATIVADKRVAQALDNPRLDAPAKESLLLSIGGDRFDVRHAEERSRGNGHGDDRKRIRADAGAGRRIAKRAREALRQENRNHRHRQPRLDR